jgi:ATP-dependent RNA helicase RhlE
MKRANTFTSLDLSENILRSLGEQGYKEPTPIQMAAIPEVLSGRDLMAAAQTGTGKTAAFSLPMLQLLSERTASPTNGDRYHRKSKKNKGNARALILTPTRELAQQIDASLRAYGRHLQLGTAVLVGGVPMGGQIKALSRKPDIIVATPGRLLDMTNRGHVRLNQVEILVLDEADRMLDMGFIHDMRRIVKQTPQERQTLLFSATLSREIADLAGNMLRDPSLIEVAPTATEAGKIAQKVLFVKQSDKLALLSTMLENDSMGRTLVFTRTKHKADRISRTLARNGLAADSIHSNKTQRTRERVLAGFGRGKIRILVATDIVARGIDVDDISHVVNFEMPQDAESYVHRIGRTARAGADGTAYTFCDADDLKMLRTIEKLTRVSLETDEDHPYHVNHIESTATRRPAESTATRRPAKRRTNGARRRSSSRSSRAYR